MPVCYNSINKEREQQEVKIMEKIENEIKKLERRMHVMDMVFGSLIGVGLFVTCVVCPLLMHLS